MSGLDRSLPPIGGVVRDFEFPPVTRLPLSNGLDLRFVQLARLPMVSLHLFMRGGEGPLSGDRAGLAVLAADALDGGTRRRSGSEMSEALERIGARLSASAGWEGTSLVLSCLAERFPDALALLGEMVREPAFPDDEVDRAKDRRLAAIRQRAMTPAALASDVALSRYYAPDAPYARTVDGTAQSVSGMGRDTLRGYADAAYRPEGGGLVIVGDLEFAEVADALETHLGSWSGAPPASSPPSAEPASASGRVCVVHRPGSVQSEIRMGHVGVARSVPEYFPLSIANMILGGMFTSRLNLNLRERHGFTYGVRSRFSMRSSAGPFEVSTAVGGGVTADAAREILFELRQIADGGATESEVRAASDYAAGVFGLRLETADQIAARVSQLVVYGLPDGYYDTYRDHVRAVSAEAVVEACARWIRPAETQCTIVGDADEVRADLEALDFARVEVVSAEV